MIERPSQEVTPNQLSDLWRTIAALGGGRGRAGWEPPCKKDLRCSEFVTVPPYQGIHGSLWYPSRFFNVDANPSFASRLVTSSIRVPASRAPESSWSLRLSVPGCMVLR